MKPIIRWLMSIYPRAWRERYEAEFLAMLDQYPLSAWDITDIAREAIIARLTYQRKERVMQRVSLTKISGIAVLISATAALIGMWYVGYDEDTGEFIIILSALPLLVAAPGIYLAYRSSQPPQQKGIPLRIIALTIAFSVSILLVMFSGRPLNMMPPYLPDSFLSLSLFAAIGNWLMLASLRALRTKTQAALLAAAGMTVGISWAIIMHSTILGVANRELVTQFTFFLGINIVVWLVSLPIWALGMGIWLRRRPPTAKLVTDKA